MPSTGTTCRQSGDVGAQGGLNEPNDKSCGVFDELIGFAVGLKVNLATNGVAKVDLAVEEVLESGRVGVWKTAPMWSLPSSCHRTRTARMDSSNVPSKSAMKVLAPLFKAFTTILRSVGPVISTRRSSRPGAGGAQTHVGSARTCAVSDGKLSCSPASRRCWMVWRASRSCRHVKRRQFCADCRWVRTYRESRRVECPVESSEECECRSRENFGLCTLDVGWRRGTL